MKGEGQSLRHQIIEWKRANTKKAEPKKVHPKESKVHSYPASKPKELVAGGEVLWEPINREAAMLLAKAPWWAQPINDPIFKTPVSKAPKEPSKRSNLRPGKTGSKPMKTATVTEVRQETQFGAKTGIEHKTIGGVEYINVDDLTLKIVEQINKHPQQLTPLARAALDARSVLRESTDQIGLLVEDFNSKVKMMLNDIRSSRMAVIGEISQMTVSLKDIRQFFLGSDYEKEISRLKEFVELCERLQKLKQSGFLDSVADTMLKLSDGG